MKTLLSAALGLVVAIAVAARADDPGKKRLETKPASSKTVVVAVGTLEPIDVVDVGVQVSGRIQKLAVDYGSVVSAGQVLAQLETAPYEAEVARAKANVQRAEAKVKMATAQFTVAEHEVLRTAKLAALKLADPSEVDAARAKVEAAKAAVYVEQASVEESKAAWQRIQLDLDYCTIRSPIEGVVLDRRCSLGQSVTASVNPSSLFLIARDLKKLQVWASVKEADIARVAPGQAVEFTVEAFPKQTFQGQVAQVRLRNAAAAAQKGAVTYIVTIDVDNKARKLLPNMTAQVSIAAPAEQP